MQFQVNRIGLDEVTLELNTTGTNEAEVNLKVPLLDEKKDYVFCVDSLTMPLNGAPINKLRGSELFRIERRNVGTPAAADLGFGTIPLFATNYTAVYTAERDFFDVTSFVSSLNNFARGFEIELTQLGIANHIGSHFGAGIAVTEAVVLDPAFDPATIAPLILLPARDEAGMLVDGVHRFLTFKMASDGSLEIFGTTSFWNNFVFNFRPEGAEALGMASEMKGYDHGVIGGVPVKTPQISYYLGLTQDDVTHTISNELTLGAAGHGILVNAGVGVHPTHFAPGNMSSSASVYSEHSLFQCLDQRLKITVESHLPTLSNVAILNEKETVDRSICEVYFEKTHAAP